MSTLSDMPLRMEVHRGGSAVVVTVSGSASMIDAPRLREKLRRLADRSKRTIILDLGGLNFIGAEGIDALLVGRELASVHHGQIRLVNPCDQIRRILELTRLTEIFGIYESVADALPAG